jgi:hypothetical protein
MRGNTPTIHCDADDGTCGNWTADYYAITVSSIAKTRITAERRAPGWLSTEDEDLCPQHANKEAA